MALFGNKENAEVAALREQLNAAHATIAELRGWVHQLRGAETTAGETELRGLRSALDQSEKECAALNASQERLRAEVGTWQSQLVETRELALLQVSWNQAREIVYDQSTKLFAVYLTKATRRSRPAMAVRVANLADAQAVAEAARIAASAPRLDIV